MIIIIEGVDGSGKTTLANKLAKQYNLRYMHFGAPACQTDIDTAFEKYCDLLLRYDNFIMDRSWYSDMVYGKVMRDNANEIKPVEVMILELLASRKGCEVIHCACPTKEIVDRLTERGEDYLPMERVQKVADAYDEIFSSTLRNLPIIKKLTSRQFNGVEIYE